MSGDQSISISTLGHRPPPPRPKPPKVYVKPKIVVSELSYPKGKNPFGDEDEEAVPVESHSFDAQESLIDVAVSNVQHSNPFDETNDEGSNEGEENAVANHSRTDNEATKNTSCWISIPNGNLNGEHITGSSCTNPFDEIDNEEVSEADNCLDSVGISNDSEEFEGKNPFRESSELVDKQLNMPSPARKKRHAPKPPATSLSQFSILNQNHSGCSDYFSSCDSHISTATSHTSPKRHEYSSVCDVSNFSERLSSPDIASICKPRNFSISCEEGLQQENKNDVVSKGPAPPLPKTERREVRAEGASAFVKYDILRQNIEAVSEKLNSLEVSYKRTQEKLKRSDESSFKYKTYIKSLQKMEEKREGLLKQQKILKTRLQLQTLEDRHADLEFELRSILSKQEHLRSVTEQDREKELLQLLLEIVKDRAHLVEEQLLSEEDEDDKDQEMKAISGKFHTIRAAVTSVILPTQAAHMSGPKKHPTESPHPNDKQNIA